MLYKDLLHFEPLIEVVELTKADDTQNAIQLVGSYVFSPNIKEQLQRIVVPNLSTTSRKQAKGMQVVGSFGTGKSHLMSVISVVAENADVLTHLRDKGMQQLFKDFAGQYKVVRFELGVDQSLKDIVFYRIEVFCEKQGIDFKFDSHSKKSWKEQILEFVAAFEEQFFDNYFLIVIDEMLEYLTSRKPDQLGDDLMFLRQLGEACSDTRFRIIFGVQEMIYNAPELQFQRDTLQKVEDRFDDILITKDEIATVVKERLLRKNEHQKEHIRQHLQKFIPLFEGLTNNFNDYVDMFPVHPRYIHHFERIKHGKKHRQILKHISNRFEALLEQPLPTDNPGLITFDSYWTDLLSNADVNGTPDIKKVKDVAANISDQIQSYFGSKSALRNRLPIARRIADALCLVVLRDDLDKKSGLTARDLRDDLCITISGIDNADLLLNTVETCSRNIVNATSGQYVEENTTNQEFHIRAEGGRNVDQDIRNYAENEMKRSPVRADEYFFDFLKQALVIQNAPYVSGFRIWPHTIQWLSKKAFRQGYIFFGNTNQKTTTQPRQEFYMLFCPIFSEKDIKTEDTDEVYFDLSGLDDNFKEQIYLYGGALSLKNTSPQNQHAIFDEKAKVFFDRARIELDRQMMLVGKVYYRGDDKPLSAYPVVGGEGITKEVFFSRITAQVLDPYFSEKHPDYPAFNDLLQPLAKDNFSNLFKSALDKIANPAKANRNGEGILKGLQVWNGTSIDVENSRYAHSIRQKLQAKPAGSVLNRDEILYCHDANANAWFSTDFHIEHALEFLVLAAMVHAGQLEIALSNGRAITSMNIAEVLKLEEHDFYSFLNVKAPRDINIEAIKTLVVKCLNLPDLTTGNGLNEKGTYQTIQAEITKLIEKSHKTLNILRGGIHCRNVALLTPEIQEEHISNLSKLTETLDKLQVYDSFGKLKTFPFTATQLFDVFSATSLFDTIEGLKAKATKFSELVGHLAQAHNYISTDQDILLKEVKKAIDDLPTLITNGSENDLKIYEVTLKDLKNRYADFYIASYVRYSLDANKAGDKTALLNSLKSQIAQTLFDTKSLQGIQTYNEWRRALADLKIADTNITKTAILNEPYMGYNPREHEGHIPLSIAAFEDRLDLLSKDALKNLRETLYDPSVKANADKVLSTERKAFLTDFQNGENVDTLDKAETLQSIINEIADSIDPIEVSFDDFKRSFKGVMKIEELQPAFDQWLNDLKRGRDAKKIRIIFK